jgi:hypothetical protein
MAAVAAAWESAAAMARTGRTATVTAVVALASGVVAVLLSLPFAVPAFVVGTAAVVVALFSAFRASHLREVRRQQDVRDR